jgi:signal transduction histidine kinase
MSHELRTPFSSFYGLLDLLSGTELDPGQSEIGANMFGPICHHLLTY